MLRPGHVSLPLHLARLDVAPSKKFFKTFSSLNVHLSPTKGLFVLNQSKILEKLASTVGIVADAFRHSRLMIL
jgi:hypothetical protein